MKPPAHPDFDQVLDICAADPIGIALKDFTPKRVYNELVENHPELESFLAQEEKRKNPPARDKESNRLFTLKMGPEVTSYWLMRRNRALIMKAQLSKIDAKETAECWFCGEGSMNWHHFLWDCSDLQVLVKAVAKALDIPGGISKELWEHEDKGEAPCTDVQREALAILAAERWNLRRNYSRQKLIENWIHRLKQTIRIKYERSGKPDKIAERWKDIGSVKKKGSQISVKVKVDLSIIKKDSDTL